MEETEDQSGIGSIELQTDSTIISTQATTSTPPGLTTTVAPSHTQGYQMFILFIAICILLFLVARWCIARMAKSPARDHPPPGSILNNMSYEQHPVDEKRAMRLSLLEKDASEDEDVLGKND